MAPPCEHLPPPGDGGGVQWRVQRAIEPVLPSRGCISDNGKAACPRHIAITIVGKVPFLGLGLEAWGTLMTTLQAVFLGIVLALMPSVALVAALFWRETIGLPSDGDVGPGV